jgi:hypothetical protein
MKQSFTINLSALLPLWILMSVAVADSPSAKPEAALPLQTEFLMQMSAELDPAQLVGETPQGDRRILYIKGGSFSGPKLMGTVLPGGGDWLLFRKDASAQLDVRTTLRTNDGALIYVNYRGVSVIPPDVRQQIMRGEDVDPAKYYFRTAPYFETSSEKYRWLNNIVAIGVGKRTNTGVVYSIYTVK